VLASSALLVVGGSLVLSQQLTLGQLVAAELIVSAVVASIAKLGKQFEAWYDALAAVDKLGHLVDLETERVDGDVPAAESSAGAAVSVRALRHAYPGGREVLRSLDFDVAAGGRLAVTGPQGSGCSTLLDLLAGMREPSGGAILVDGLDLRAWSLEALRSKVMLLRSQDIFNGTVADNVGLALPGVGMEQVQAALARAGLLDDVLAMPQGLATPLVTGGLPLSSRQRNRLLVARALLLRPRLLLLDELLDGLDPATSGAMLDIILDPACDWTVVAATRDPAVASRFPSRLSLQASAS
ncbi:MAG: ATP-binding cassette domain-containing protein, partial [Opitutia bacterium]|jgi:putative ABC transport system ATP-binding protein